MHVKLTYIICVLSAGVICAAPMYDTGCNWIRSQIVQSYPETDEIELKSVDFGGYMTSQGCLMRQIRSDFSQLPFQAVECYLTNVMPPNGRISRLFQFSL